jgi:hypothetical protein
VEALTGMKTSGLFQKLADPAGGFAYRLRFGRRTFIYSRQEDEWLVTVGDANGIHGVWRNTPDEAANSGARLIDTILELTGDQRALFQRQFVQASPEIHRKSYKTGRGEVWLHTRRNDHGSEGALQLPDGRVLRYQWERDAGHVLLDEVPIDTVPF